jgi:pimeloyl-ACP methyl ester carboxylesterase
VEDLFQLLVSLKFEKAHIAGLSMGGGVAINLAFAHPEMCTSLVVASTGTGSMNPDQFRQDGRAIVERLGKEGMAGVVDFFTLAPARIKFREKDPRGWEDARRQMAEHSALGSALTFSKVQTERASIFDLEAKLKKLQVPTLILAGDEDAACIEPAVFMKRSVPHSGLMVFPRSGHALNLEEPAFFNRAVCDFLSAVKEGKWV